MSRDEDAALGGHLPGPASVSAVLARSRGIPYHTRILIVDDQATIVANLQKILGEHYVLKTATCGEEALAIAADFSPALILLDIMMPGIDGYDTCCQLRAHPILRHAKIIMVSSAASVTERLRGYEVGADDYIIKPFDEEELLAKVGVYLRLKSVEEVDRLKSDMLALLSHEVHTPLNEILAPVDMLLAEQDMNAADQTMLLNLLQHSAQRLLRLFARISKLSQMKAGQWDYAWTTTDLCDVVRDAVSYMTSSAVQRDVHIAQALPDAALARLDRLQIGEVVAAVLENAIRFSPSPGRVALAVEHTEERICIRVTDRGPGLDPEFLPFVFEPLAQPDLRYHTEGQGLSLAIAHEIVLAHHGTIRVESTPRVGTAVTVWLPAAMGTKGGNDAV
jgi:two-component system, sensor histidine kinase and response regulator